MQKQIFKARIEIIGVNPFVFLPQRVLKNIFEQAGKDKGKIPVIMRIDGHQFPQTLIKYSGKWRLYLNTPMRKAAGKDVGDKAAFEITFNPVKKEIPFHPKLKLALKENHFARKIFEQLPPSRQLEIKRYIIRLKTEAAIEKNVKRAIGFLLGKERFIGRNKPAD